jgi:anti-sigma factor RsiW
MPCDVWREQLDSYVDGELSSSEANALAEHLKGCGECAAEALGRVQLKRSVAVAGKRNQPSTEFQTRVMQSVTRPSARSSVSFWNILLVPALAILVISLAVAFYAGRGQRNRDRVYGELADLHVSTLASATPVDVVSTDRHTVKPWFEGKIPFAFNLPELHGTSFELVGGRVTYLGQMPGAQLIYRLRKHEISVFVFQSRVADVATFSARPLQAHSFHIEGWDQNGLRFFVIGDVADSDIEALSQLLRNANGS